MICFCCTRRPHQGGISSTQFFLEFRQFITIQLRQYLCTTVNDSVLQARMFHLLLISQTNLVKLLQALYGYDDTELLCLSKKKCDDALFEKIRS